MRGSPAGSRLWAWLSPSILELENVSAHVNRSDFRQNFNGHDIWQLGGTVSQIGAAFAFLTTYGQSRRLSGLSLRPEGSPIYKNTRELFESGSRHGHFGVCFFKIRRLSFFSQIGTRFLPLLIRKLKKSVSRSISGLEKRYTHVNRSEFHQKTIGIETCSLRGPLLRDRAGFAFLTSRR